MSDLSAGFYLNLGQRPREVRRKAGLHQSAVAREMGFTPNTGQVFTSRLEHGKAAVVTPGAVVRCLQACKVPVGKFTLELARSGAFGEARAEDVRESAAGFTSHRLRGKTCDDRATSNEAKQAKARLSYWRHSESETNLRSRDW